MWGTSKKNAAEIAELKERINKLEDANRSFMMTLQNLQSAILSLSRSHDHVATDVHSIQDMVSAFLAEVDAMSTMFPYNKKNPEA